MPADRDTDREGKPQNARQFATLLSHRDLVQLVRRCIDAPDSVRFAIFYGVSNNTWRFWDISNSRELIGYEPEDDAEHGGSPATGNHEGCPYALCPKVGNTGFYRALCCYGCRLMRL